MALDKNILGLAGNNIPVIQLKGHNSLTFLPTRLKFTYLNPTEVCFNEFYDACKIVKLSCHIEYKDICIQNQNNDKIRISFNGSVYINSKEYTIEDQIKEEHNKENTDIER